MGKNRDKGTLTPCVPLSNFREGDRIPVSIHHEIHELHEKEKEDGTLAIRD